MGNNTRTRLLILTILLLVVVAVICGCTTVLGEATPEVNEVTQLEVGQIINLYTNSPHPAKMKVTSIDKPVCMLQYQGKYYLCSFVTVHGVLLFQKPNQDSVYGGWNPNDGTVDWLGETTWNLGAIIVSEAPLASNNLIELKFHSAEVIP